jgi:Domain of unknown function (DUF4345)
MQIRLLQIVVALAGVVPVTAGLAGVIMGSSMVAPPGEFSVQLDSHYRYLSGLLLALGVGFWSTIPHIGLQGTRFRMLTMIVVVGGLGRFVSVCVVGWPGWFMLFGLSMELIVTPLLAFWQFHLERARRG